MLLFVLIGHVPIVLLLAQLGMLYLAIVDMHQEADLDFQVKVWWVLLVLLFGVVGFIAEKVWVTVRRAASVLSEEGWTGCPPPVPAGLDRWRERPDGAAWLERLPGLVTECCARWDLVLGAPFEPATISYVAPVTRSDGTPAVLKVNFPEPESEHEAAALAHWDGAGRGPAARIGSGAPRAARRALCAGRSAVERRGRGAGRPAGRRRAPAPLVRAPPPAGHPFRTLAGEARRWADELPARWERHARPFDRALLDRAVGWIGELLASGAEGGAEVLLHQDLHGGNALRAARGAATGSRSTPSRSPASAPSTSPRCSATAARSSPPTRIPRRGSAAASTA